MKFSMEERRVLIKSHAKEYQRAEKQEKGRILSKSENHFYSVAALSKERHLLRGTEELMQSILNEKNRILSIDLPISVQIA